MTYEDFWSITEGVLFRKNALRVMVELRKGPKRFTDLYHVFGSPVTLSLRLGELERLGLVNTKLVKESGAYKKKNGVYYELTEKGQELMAVFSDFQSRISDKMKDWKNGEA